MTSIPTMHDLPEPQATDPLGLVLADVVAYLDRFMAASEPQLYALALWVALTYVADRFDVVAYLFVTSPEKRSGKSLLLDLLEHLACHGRSTANISPAALYRMIGEHHPTLLIDEVDTIFASKGKNMDPQIGSSWPDQRRVPERSTSVPDGRSEHADPRRVRRFRPESARRYRQLPA